MALLRLVFSEGYIAKYRTEREIHNKRSNQPNPMERKWQLQTVLCLCFELEPVLNLHQLLIMNNSQRSDQIDFVLLEIAFLTAITIVRHISQTIVIAIKVRMQ